MLPILHTGVPIRRALLSNKGVGQGLGVSYQHLNILVAAFKNTLSEITNVRIKLLLYNILLISLFSPVSTAVGSWYFPQLDNRILEVLRALALCLWTEPRQLQPDAEATLMV